MTAANGTGGWRPMSPDDVRRTPLRESGLGRRGYRPEDVDRLRNQLASEIERWARAYAEAEAEVQRLREYYRRQGVDVDSRSRPGRHDAVSPEAVQLMARAQAYADQVVAEAQAQARHVQADARAQAENIVGQARREADDAGQAYRARAGESYSADREEAERLVAWARSILATMQAVQHQLGATADAFSLELLKFGSGSSVPPPGAHAPGQHAAGGPGGYQGGGPFGGGPVAGAPVPYPPGPVAGGSVAGGPVPYPPGGPAAPTSPVASPFD